MTSLHQIRQRHYPKLLALRREVGLFTTLSTIYLLVAFNGNILIPNFCCLFDHFSIFAANLVIDEELFNDADLNDLEEELNELDVED